MISNQEAFEIESHYRAINKLEKEVQRAKDLSYYSSTEQARATIKTWALPMTEDLVAYVDKFSNGRASTKASAVGCPEIAEWFQIVEPNILMVIVLKTIFDAHGVHQKLTLSKLAQMIGTRFEDEARFRFYEITAPKEVVEMARKRVQETGSSPRYRRLSTKLITEKMLDELGIDEDAKWKRWSDHYRILLGMAMVEFCFVEGLINKTTVQVSKTRKATFVDLSDKTKFYQEQIFNRIKELSYFAYPLIEPPLPWLLEVGEARDNTSGGYHTDFIREQTPLCRGRYRKSKFGSTSIDFLNLLGDVRWCLYPETVELAQTCLEKGRTIGSLRALFDNPLLTQTMPEEISNQPLDSEERKEWRRWKKAIYTEHEQLRRKSIRSRQAVSMATEFNSYDEFYLSWSNDYRGRVYSEQPWLNIQTSDFEKSMLTFVDGKPLTERGELWSAQAVGASFLGSTRAFSERTTWTFENKELLRAVANDPLGTQSLWEGAKEPWTFVQLCLEWNKVVLDKTQTNWTVPIGADATASGLQLLSSMLRDPVGMKFSNVIPPEDAYSPPCDSYLQVLSLARLRALQTPETEHLAPYLVESNRNIGKTTMVHLYGATHGTIRDKIISVFVKLKIYGVGKEVTWKMCDEMTYLVEQSARDVFPSAYEALDWLKKLGKVASAKGITEFNWFVPSGDNVSLQEFKSLTTRINTSHLGKVVIPIGRSKEIDLAGMKKALAPSFIHSYDASLLKLSFKDWTEPLGVIHDCVRVLPSDVDDAHARIREAFIKNCEGNPLNRLADDIGVTEEELPRLTQGNQNLEVVRDSPYLFN